MSQSPPSTAQFVLASIQLRQVNLHHREEFHDELVVRDGEPVGGLLLLRLLENARCVSGESGERSGGGERGIEGRRENGGFARAIRSENGGKETKKVVKETQNDVRIASEVEKRGVEAWKETEKTPNNSKAAESLSPKDT